MSHMSGDLIRSGLSTHVFGQNVVYTRQTGSTNSDLKKVARQNAPEGLLFVTDEQLVGRGRLKRNWYAPPESSLLTSLLFRPGDIVAPPQTQYLTMLCALAMADSIKKHAGISPGLKWPNDIVWQDGRKLGGILTEFEVEGNHLGWVIVGVGLNVNIEFGREVETAPNRTETSPVSRRPLEETAISLSMLLGRNTADLRLPILQQYLINVETRYHALRQGQLPRDEWESRLIGLGQAVTVTVLDDGRAYEGVMAGIDDYGALRVTQADGLTMTFIAGDVTLR